MFLLERGRLLHCLQRFEIRFDTEQKGSFRGQGRHASRPWGKLSQPDVGIEGMSRIVLCNCR